MPISSDPTPPRLHARTIEIADPGPLTALLPESDAYAWLRHGEGMIGWGEVARCKPTTIDDAEEWWTGLVAQVIAVSDLEHTPGAGFMAFGSFVFDPVTTAARSTLVVPATVLGRRNGRAWLTQIGTSFVHADSLPVVSAPRPPQDVCYADGGLTGPEWEAAVAKAVRRITAGDLEKVVLARDLLATAREPLDLRWLLGQLAGRYERCWSYLVDGLVGATPELLLRREGGLVTSRVLAGTIRRSGDNSRDLASAAALARSSKDLEEHEYAVASVADALTPYCSGMNVPDAPYVLELPNVLHLATDVTAVANPGRSSLGLAAALHPTAAVCGTPTDIARTTIAELEHLDRERYAGPVGWIDAGGDGEWGIALRCGLLDETDPRLIRLFAGCGVVAGSDPEAELSEANAKLVPMREALG
ncbi:MAG: isochorismate synthase [Microlunatus sp.]|nr:isochorismate synthase [Microlunatus sp.]MDN5770378.1 isochorismate synthase [Microlunatus sp.]MDN5804035.1 isochorismate synthase [Microlunatus sp.]